MKFAKGELILMTEGEYSDYSVVGLVRVLEDFNGIELMKEWVALDPANLNKRDAYERFLSWLQRDRKLLEEVDYREWHPGYLDFTKP